MKKLAVLAAIFSAGVVHQAQSQVTLLVNFWNHSNGPERYTTASSADYQAEDSWVNLSAEVNKVSFDNSVESGAISAVGMTGVSVSNQGNWTWNTANGSYADTPILDSYFYDEVGGLGRTLTVDGFEEIAAGATVRFTVWGVGDSVGANTDYQLNYNGTSVSGDTTDYVSGPLSYQFTFVKADGVDTVTVDWGKSGTTTSGFGGFAMTTVPEPSTVALLAIGATGFVLAKRRRSRSK